jgi:hypothetical protein
MQSAFHNDGIEMEILHKDRKGGGVDIRRDARMTPIHAIMVGPL